MGSVLLFLQPYGRSLLDWATTVEGSITLKRYAAEAVILLFLIQPGLVNFIAALVLIEIVVFFSQCDGYMHGHLANHEEFFSDGQDLDQVETPTD